MNPYSTHLTMLTKAIHATKGDVLELGVGDGSTPVLHRLCAAQGRRLVSMDNDAAYLERFESFRSPLHELILVDDWDNADIERPWSVVLVDHRPGARRKTDAARLAPFAEYVVCHDTDPERDRVYKFSRIYKFFKHRFDDDSQKPQTTVLSNFTTLDWMKGII